MLYWKMLFIIIVVPLSIVACGHTVATGPLFCEAMITAPKEHAIVYIYRKSPIVRSVDFDIILNRQTKIPLQNDGYHMLVLPSGTYEIMLSERKRFLGIETYDLASGATYFIKFLASGSGGGMVLLPIKFEYGIKVVPKQEALPELKQCRLIETPLVVDGVVQTLKPYGWSEIK